MQLFETYQLSSHTSGTMGGALGGTSLLRFVMEHQQESQWCWAATSKSVANYYNQIHNWTQCGIASVVLKSQCCQDHFLCNQPWVLEEPLNVVRCLHQMLNRSLTFNEIVSEINRDKVICARIGWNPRGGHFVSVMGYELKGGIPWVFIDDPWFGPSDMPYSKFVNSYKDNGIWTHSYLTSYNTNVI